MLDIFNSSPSTPLAENNPTWEQLSEYAKKILCNGCGAKGGIFKAPSFVFKKGCNQHDFCYWRGGGAGDRKEADRQFLMYMITRAVESDWYVRPFHILLSLMYYSAVRWQGGKFFRYRENVATWDDLYREFPQLVGKARVEDVV